MISSIRGASSTAGMVCSNCGAWLGPVLQNRVSIRPPIYYGNRAGLEDRVFRIRTERSLASTPLPRTCHMVSVVDCMVENDGSVRVESNWTTHSYKFEKATSFFGTQTHILREDDDGELRIAWREVIVMNDMIPSVLDIYSV